MESKMRIKVLRAKRSGIKASLLQFAKYLANYAPNDYVQLSLRYEKLRKSFEDFDEWHDELDAYDNSEGSVSERFAILDRYYEVMSRAQLRAQQCQASMASDGVVVVPTATRDDDDFEQKVFAVSTKSLCSSSSDYSAPTTPTPQPKEDQYARTVQEILWFLNLPQLLRSDRHEAIERFAGELRQRVHTLSSLGVPVPQEFVVVLVQERYFDKVTRAKWESGLSAQPDFPTLEQLYAFLDALAAASRQELADKLRKEASLPSLLEFESKKRSSSTRSARQCYACPDGCHPLTKCDAFRNFSVRQRLRLVADAGVCEICLNRHGGRDCRSTARCRICAKKHHTWLHLS